MKNFVFLAALALAPVAAHADTVRAAVGRPLQQAEALIARHDYQAALLQVGKARAAGHLTAYETLVTTQVEGMAASGAGEYGKAAADYEMVLSSGSVPVSERLRYLQAIAGFYDQAHDDPDTIIWTKKYIAAGGTAPRTRMLLAQAYYDQGNFAQAEQAAQRDENATEASGGTPAEPELQLLASSAAKFHDQAGYRAALLALLRVYPSRQYWAAAIASVTAMPGFPDRLTLDVDRLSLATGTLTAAADYEDYAERAILDGNPAEANRVIETGFSSGVLNDQTDAGHAARLRVLAAKQAAASPASPADEIRKVRADDADDPDGALNLGVAYADSENRPAAAASFEKLIASPSNPSDPDIALARLWLIYVEK